MRNSVDRLLYFQHIVFWIGFLFINGFVSFTFLPWREAAWRFSVIALLNVLVYIFCYRYPVNRFFETKRYPTFLGVLLGMLLVSSVFRSLLMIALDGFSEFKVPSLVDPSGKSVGIVLVIFTQALVIVMATLLAISKNKMLAERRLADLLAVKTQTELSLLKAKINPHFLLNTLNNIYYYNQEENPKGGEAILKLGELLRYTIYDSSQPRIPLAKEVETIESLHRLYALRFHTEPNIHLHIEHASLLEAEVPPGILLILFENALKYSAVGTDAESYIRVKISRQNGQLHLYVQNSIAHSDRSLQNVYGGMGLHSLRQILALEYPDSHSLLLVNDHHVYTANLSMDVWKN